ncbi:cytochrome c oxidase subunit II [Paenibacillus athensensis]|uniref:Cytochrome aa3 subunit 2 n=1 Tax=Paenibacillus athensensis TaxID=1967502 RepID=A0A4Y8Q1W7_9BACL|nr:cytochrome c oxidase subunit II [Paenibacillus athensensis]MCD1261018.1 cytochrome c oxidase subunit II [Paenibacillus athensensis]
MHIHRLEKIWLTVGITMLFVFLAVLGVSAFAMGTKPPSEHHHRIDPTQVDTTAPFDKPGLTKIGDNEYEAVMTAFTFGYAPDNMEIPAGATVHFTVTSKDVVHGFAIPGTNVNMMIVPGEISQITHTFTEPGEFLVLCNEYCGGAHEWMKTKIIVK